MDSPVVLVVDDEEDLRVTTREVLEEEGYTVEIATNGVEALRRLLEAPPPALVLLDLMMPRMDGVTLLREIEQRAELAWIPVIILTAASLTPATSGLRYPLLRKPFSIQALLEAVKTYSPRLWDEEESPTDERATASEIPAILRDTRPEACAVCKGRAQTRCPRCGEAFCRGCLDAGPDGRCARCWRGSKPAQ